MIDIHAFTHAAPAPCGDGFFIFFNMEKCPCCGADIYNNAEATPNIKLEGPGLTPARAKRYVQKHFTLLEELPPDLWVDFHDGEDQDEEWGCELCFGKAPEKEDAA